MKTSVQDMDKTPAAQAAATLDVFSACSSNLASRMLTAWCGQMEVLEWVAYMWTGSAGGLSQAANWEDLKMTAWMEGPLSYLLLQQRQASSANTVQCESTWVTALDLLLHPSKHQAFVLCYSTQRRQLQMKSISTFNCFTDKVLVSPQRPESINFKAYQRATMIWPVSHHVKKLMKPLRIPWTCIDPTVTLINTPPYASKIQDSSNKAQ